jgi:hypothetical protein
LEVIWIFDLFSKEICDVAFAIDVLDRNMAQLLGLEHANEYPHIDVA